jgi:hypothetical protein
MTISSAQYTIGTTRSVIIADDLFPEEVHLHSGSGTIYVGGADVTAANGYRMDNGDKVVLQNHDNPVYAITSSGTAILYVLIVQK